jgi:hypothetical protein
MRETKIVTSDKARFHASVEGTLEIDPGLCPQYVVDEDRCDYRTDIDELLKELVGRRVHIIIFAEP